MNTKIILKTLTGILFMSAIVPSSVASDFCRNLNVSFSRSLANGQLLAGDLSFVSKNEGSSSAHLAVLNRTTKRIDRIVLLIELRDEQDQFVMSIPLAAAIAEASNSKGSHIFMNTNKLLDKSISPSETVELVGATEVTTSRCPTRAMVSVIELEFGDGTQYLNSISGWTQLGRVASVSALQLATFPGSLPHDELLSISLDATGRIQSLDARTRDTKIREWFEKQVSAWSFAPTIVDGQRVPSRLSLLIRVHAVGQGQHTEMNTADISELIPVDVSFQENSALEDQTIKVGGIPLLIAARSSVTHGDVPCPPLKCSLH